MHPTLFSIGFFQVYSYGALIALGGALSCFIWHRKKREMGIQRDEYFWRLINVILVGGFIGGRALFIIEYVPFTASEVWSAIWAFNKGFSVLGAFVGVAGGVYLYCRCLRLDFLRVLDYVSLVAPFWHIFGRLGCFAAGCCFGRPSSLPWAVRFTDAESLVPGEFLGTPLHPTQLYEAFGDLGIFLALHLAVMPRVEKGRFAQGSVSAGYFAAYGVLRFLTEYCRGDAVSGVLGLTAGQWISLGLIAAGAGIMVWSKARPCIRS